MGEKGHLLSKLSAVADAPMMGIPLVEIAGCSRVLVEHHQGITEYSTENVTLKVSFGQIRITGCELMIRQMSSQQLVISGQIGGVSLIRRCDR